LIVVNSIAARKLVLSTRACASVIRHVYILFAPLFFVRPSIEGSSYAAHAMHPAHRFSSPIFLR
jgi:hypothetical protein